MTELSIHPRFESDFSLQINAIVLNELTNVQFSSDISEFPHLNNLLLPDPAINSYQKTDLLLGVAEYAKILKIGLFKGPQFEPIAQHSEFGWIISGQTGGSNNRGTDSPSSSSIQTTISNVSTIDDELNRILRTRRVGGRAVRRSDDNEIL